MRRTETPKPIWIIFCVVVDITDVVTYTNFGDHRLRGFWVAGGQIFPFPIDFDRRPYSTVALPCECVTVFVVLVQSCRESLQRCATMVMQFQGMTVESLSEEVMQNGLAATCR